MKTASGTRPSRTSVVKNGLYPATRLPLARPRGGRHGRVRQPQQSRGAAVADPRRRVDQRHLLRRRRHRRQRERRQPHRTVQRLLLREVRDVQLARREVREGAAAEVVERAEGALGLCQGCVRSRESLALERGQMAKVSALPGGLGVCVQLGVLVYSVEIRGGG